MSKKNPQAMLATRLHVNDAAVLQQAAKARGMSTSALVKAVLMATVNKLRPSGAAVTSTTK